MFITAIILSVASIAPTNEYPLSPFSFPVILAEQPKKPQRPMVHGSNQPAQAPRSALPTPADECAHDSKAVNAPVSPEVADNDYPVHPNVQKVRDAMNGSAVLIEHIKNSSKCKCLKPDPAFVDATGKMF